MNRDRPPISIRQLEPADRALVAEGFESLSPATVIARFLGPVKARLSLFAWVDELDGHDRIALGATHADTGEPLGLARFVRVGEDGAELAVTVVDGWQGRGVGTALLE